MKSFRSTPSTLSLTATLLFLLVAASVDRPSTAVDAATTDDERDQHRLRRQRGAVMDIDAAVVAEDNFMRILAAEERNMKRGGDGTDDEDWAFWVRELNGSHSVRRWRDLLEERNHMASEERGGKRRLEQQVAADFGAAEIEEDGALSTEDEDAAFWTRALEGGSMS